MKHSNFLVTHFVLTVIKIKICEADFRINLANEIVTASTILTEQIDGYLKLFNQENQIARPLNFSDLIINDKKVKNAMEVLRLYNTTCDLDLKVNVVSSILKNDPRAGIEYWSRIFRDTFVIKEQLTVNYDKELEKCVSYDSLKSSKNQIGRSKGRWRYPDPCVIREEYLDQIKSNTDFIIEAIVNKKLNPYEKDLRISSLQQHMNRLINTYIIEPVNNCLLENNFYTEPLQIF